MAIQKSLGEKGRKMNFKFFSPAAFLKRNTYFYGRTFLLPCWCKETEEKEGMLRKAMPLIRPTDINGKKQRRVNIHVLFFLVFKSSSLKETSIPLQH